VSGGFPLEAYRALFPPGTRGEGVPLGVDGDHYSPDPHFFEWWYFDVALDDGGWLVVVFHSALFNLGNHRPTVDVRYYPPDGRPVVAIGQYEREEYTAARGPFRLRIGPSSVEVVGGAYRLSVREGGLRADLTFAPELPGWRVGSGRLFADPRSGRAFHWVVPVPLARVTGEIALPGGEGRPVAGVGYHDHNWGTVYLPSAFGRWRWGRVWGGGWTVIFGDLRAARGESAVRPLLLGRDGEVYEAAGLSSEWGEETTFLLGEEGVSLRLAHERLLDRVTFAALRPVWRAWRRIAEPTFYASYSLPLVGGVVRSALGIGTYRRWTTSGRLHRAGQQVAVRGVLEEMRLCQGGER